jgi:hypothetical protein
MVCLLRRKYNTVLALGMVVGHIYSWTLGGMLTFAIPVLCTHKINLFTKLKKKYRICIFFSWSPKEKNRFLT